MSSNAIECHIKFGNLKNNPDFSSSISLDELKFLVDFRDYFHELNTYKVNKNIILPNVKNKKTFCKKSSAYKKYEKR